MRLDLSIGPVQGFVSRSRRTRDLWGSSYLLSFLAAHAMRGAVEAGGTVVRPLLSDDPLYRWVTGGRDGDPPRIGSVPNHFVVEVDGEAREVASASARALDAAWRRVCAAVWERFVLHACPSGDGTEEIWNRQVQGFWEVVWTAGPSAAEGLLRRRKHWRSHHLPDEPGDKCTVMHDLQELSGHVRSEGAESRRRQDEFWRRVRGRTGPLDLREDERLCALALAKRLFPRVSLAALGWEVDAAHWPSTAYVGALPWIRRVLAVAPDRAAQYAEAVLQCAPPGALAERRPPFAGLVQAASGDFPRLDANYFHRAFVRDERLCPLEGETPEDSRADLLRRLVELEDSKDPEKVPLGSPPSFYALVLADGDRLGRLVGRLGSERVGRALTRFTKEVPEIVGAHDGVTVYAGGDDVLAMMPVPGALSCAAALADGYGEAFEGAEATLSAAVVLAPLRLPLGRVLDEAHRLLDQVAKEANGRNSLAVSVLKRGGLHCQWATTWTRRQPEAGSSRATDVLTEVVAILRDEATEPGLATSLLYRLRETLSLLCGWPRWSPGTWGTLPGNLDLRAFLYAEILRSLDGRTSEKATDRAGELTETVLKLLGPSRTVPRDGITEVGLDALLLARFLAGPEDHEEDRA